jgi:transcriptional regulator with XRE-family HTH domain
MTRAYVTPDALRWARETSGLSIEDAAQRADVSAEAVAAAEAGEDYLTFRQAERLADAYERPVAALFAPNVPHEEPPEAGFVACRARRPHRGLPSFVSSFAAFASTRQRRPTFLSF